MAVIDSYVNTDRVAGRLQSAARHGGGKIHTVFQSFASAAADSDTSKYRIFSIPSNAVPLPGGAVRHDNIANGTGISFGLYVKGPGGAEVDKAVFKASATFANTTVMDPFELANTVTNAGLKIWELLGLSADPHVEYDYVIYGGTVGDGGNFNVYAQYLTE